MSRLVHAHAQKAPPLANEALGALGARHASARCCNWSVQDSPQIVDYTHTTLDHAVVVVAEMEYGDRMVSQDGGNKSCLDELGSESADCRLERKKMGSQRRGREYVGTKGRTAVSKLGLPKLWSKRQISPNLSASNDVLLVVAVRT